MHDENKLGLPNDVTIDIRPGHFGGDWPLKVDFRLRSFNAMLNFLGLPIAEEPEYDVEKDSRTPKVAENPVKTLDPVVSPSAPSGLGFIMRSHGHYYAVNTTGPTGSLEPRSVQALVPIVPDDGHGGPTRRRTEHYHRKIMKGDTMFSGEIRSSHSAQDGIENAACHRAMEPNIQERERNNDYGHERRSVA